jgi:hypothetical protein
LAVNVISAVHAVAGPQHAWVVRLLWISTIIEIYGATTVVSVYRRGTCLAKQLHQLAKQIEQNWPKNQRTDYDKSAAAPTELADAMQTLASSTASYGHRDWYYFSGLVAFFIAPITGLVAGLLALHQ